MYEATIVTPNLDRLLSAEDADKGQYSHFPDINSALQAAKAWIDIAIHENNDITK